MTHQFWIALRTPRIGKLPWIVLTVNLETKSRGQAGDDGGSSMTQV